MFLQALNNGDAQYNSFTYYVHSPTFTPSYHRNQQRNKQTDIKQFGYVSRLGGSEPHVSSGARRLVVRCRGRFVTQVMFVADVILKLMLTLPRSSVANIRRKMAPLMKLDIVGVRV